MRREKSGDGIDACWRCVAPTTRWRVWGRTRGQAPDIDGVACFPQETQVASGEIVPVRIVGTADYDLHVSRLPGPLASPATC